MLANVSRVKVDPLTKFVDRSAPDRRQSCQYDLLTIRQLAHRPLRPTRVPRTLVGAKQALALLARDVPVRIYAIGVKPALEDHLVERGAVQRQTLSERGQRKASSRRLLKHHCHRHIFACEHARGVDGPSRAINEPFAARQASTGSAAFPRGVIEVFG
jgi:hypothetical protein